MFKDVFPSLASLLPLSECPEITSPFRNASLFPIILVGCLFSFSSHPARHYFGLMNISALFAHCLLNPYTLYWRIAIQVDIGFTCISALSLVHKIPTWLIPGILAVSMGGYDIQWMNEVLYIGSMIYATLMISYRTLSKGITQEYILSVLVMSLVPMSFLLNTQICKCTSGVVSINHVTFVSSLIVIYLT